MLKNLPNNPDIMLLKEKANMLIMCETLFYQDSEKYVEQLLTLFNRFSRLVKEAFQDDPRFLTARDKVSATFTSLTIDSTQQHLINSFSPPNFPQAYKAVVNDATIFKLELPMKQKG